MFLYKSNAVVLITVCPRSIDPFYIVNYYIKWSKTSWTDSTTNMEAMKEKEKYDNIKLICNTALFSFGYLVQILNLSELYVICDYSQANSALKHVISLQEVFLKEYIPVLEDIGRLKGYFCVKKYH